jgi:hypothetical protein
LNLEILERQFRRTRNSRIEEWQQISKTHPSLAVDLQACVSENSNIDSNMQRLYKKLSNEIYGYWVQDSELNLPKESSEKDNCLLRALYLFAKREGVELDGIQIRQEGFKATLADWEERRDLTCSSKKKR